MLSWIDRIGADSSDTPEIRLQKKIMARLHCLFIIADVAWGFIYFYFDEWIAGCIPFGHGLVTLACILFLGITKKYCSIRFIQLSLTLFLPFFLSLALGGFVNSSAVLLWSLMAPLIAVLIDEPKRFIRWFFAFLVLVVVSAFAEPYLRKSNNLPAWVITLFFVLNFTAVSTNIFALFYYFTRQNNELRQKAERLLLNILPAEIAEVLKDKDRTIAERYKEASILFADIVNFTPMSVNMTSVELVDLLNEVFSHFDSLVDKYGLEKIKTIGDCYMVASGVPIERSDHAQALTSFALDVRDLISRYKFRGKLLDFRIGINSGPVVAGVIGNKKFIYDLWGDSVNTASRMESHGIGGAIQVTEATYNLIKDDFICEPRGKIRVKGKGEMKVWHVIKVAH